MEEKFPHIYKVEASAGSGKTEKLSKRYVSFLLSNYPHNDLSEILAITFTNKASLEMRDRVFKSLKEIGLYDENEEKRNKSKFLVNKIINNYTDFNIRTIDSFMDCILKVTSNELSLPIQYDIITDASPYIEYCIDELLSENDISLLIDFIKHYIEVEGKTSWSPKKIIQSEIKYLREKENQFSSEFFSSLSNKDFYDCVKSIKDLASEFEEDSNINLNFNKLLQKLKEGKIQEALKSTYLNKVDIKHNLIEKWQLIKERIIYFCELKSYIYYNYYINFFNKIKSKLEEIRQNKRIIFIDELNNQINRLFAEGYDAPFIYYKLGNKFFHFLIDEFQDTSEIQWNNIKPIIEEGLSQGGTLFYVGDRKQAIYRFRGGKVSLLDEIKNSFPSIEEIKEERLNINYRSKKNLVMNFYNKVFCESNLRRWLTNEKCLCDVDIDKVINTYNNAYQEVEERKDKEGGHVEIKKIMGNNKEEIKTNVKIEFIPLIKNILKYKQPQKIGVLLRDNADVELITHWLNEENIPVLSERTINIRESAIINEIISFIKFLNSPGDNLSFISFILGDIFTFAVNLNKNDIYRWIFELGEIPQFIYLKFREWQPKIWNNYISELFSEVGFLPIYDLTVKFMKKFNVLNNFEKKEGFFMHLLEIIKNLEDKEKNSLNKFIEFWNTAEDKYFLVPVSQETPAIKVMTIHKAKGIDFDVVIIPFTEIEIKRDKKIINTDKDGLRLMYLTKDLKEWSPTLQDIYKREFTLNLIDELNTLYVGVTRAKEELYLFLPEKNNLALSLICDELD